MTSCEWFPMGTAPKDREILAADKDGSRAIVRWDGYKGGYWALTQTGGYAEDDDFDAVQWAPGALVDAPPAVEATKTYWWDTGHAGTIPVR